MKKYWSLLCASIISWSSFGQAPSGYYDSADSLVGNTLRTALREIIRNHTVRSYGDLWDGYGYTDRLPNGKIWDMYSHNPNGAQPYEFTYRTDQCGNYNSEADCYNREHTWPQSMFGKIPPMESDILLVIPTDGYVNSKRDNNPYGVVSSPTWTSANGSKLGLNTYPNSPNVPAFEPIDEYKGDIARIMFYVVTRYYQLDNNWSDWTMANKTELKPWAKQMFLDWHNQDPVSDKERNRNNGAFSFQNNRNPYVDRPEFVPCVFDPANCIWANGGVDTGDVDSSNSIPQLLTLQEVNLYPNPVHNTLHIDVTKVAFLDPIKVEIFDITGRLCYESYILSNRKQHELSLETLNKGFYVIKLSNDDLLFLDKIVKN